jgi:histidyl-tRNA synthetase
MASIKALRGTRDILPAEIGYWQLIEEKVQQILARALYQEIRTPLIEQTDLFVRGIGTETDVVGKEMYTFSDQGERQITLRPEGTAGAVRSYIEHGLDRLGGVQRLWYKGPMFRYERPQAGRQRQFHQIGLELLGSGAPRADVEVIALASDVLKSLGLKNLTLNLNSIGDKIDRDNYKTALVEYFTPLEMELDVDSRERLKRNPLRILDSKDSRTQQIAQNAPKILDYLSKESMEHFEQVQNMLTELEIAYQVNPFLVRGLDYYTHTAFEIQSSDLGAQSTVCGGGRYDGLVGELGGVNTQAIGWAMGIERLILLIKEIKPITTLQPDFYLVSKGQIAEGLALKIAQKLRAQNCTVELDLSSSAFGKQFKRADRSGASIALILGDTEALINIIKLKWLDSGQEESISIADLIAKPQRYLDRQS